ncbi:MAG: DUF6685 family protein [Moraxellaceae bacterium]|nr:DUF6685 family protein [Moraxellaceae bacterium]
MFSTFICEYLGHPVKLDLLFKRCPEAFGPLEPPPSSIYALDVVEWGALAKPAFTIWPSHQHGTLLGWRQENGSYRRFELFRQEYIQIVQHEKANHWACDISEVDGFASSKSQLTKFKTTDDMVETNSQELISEITHEKLTSNLAHKEIRIIHSPGSDYFCRSLWDGKLFLINSGGSHHLAAAKYIAKRLKQQVLLKGTLNTYRLNFDAIKSLQHDFEIFVINGNSAIEYEFKLAMESFRATWLSHSMPSPYHEAFAVVLPKAEWRSMKVATWLTQVGATNLGEYLIALASKQSTKI